MQGRIMAALLAAALFGHAAAAAVPAVDGFCQGVGWEALDPEEVPPELLNLTLTEFDSMYTASEDNPYDEMGVDDPLWVPCEPEELDVQVQAACQQLDGEAVAYQLQVSLNCSHAAPLPHSDLATFVANVTLGASSEDVSFTSVSTDLDPSHTTPACDDPLCAACADPSMCDQCQEGYSVDPATNECTTVNPAPEDPAAVGSSAAPARTKPCPVGKYLIPYLTNPDGSPYCLECTRLACNDCGFCDYTKYPPNFCYQEQQCIPPPSGGRSCIEGYHYKNGGCTLCKYTIPNCAFCDACKKGTPQCLDGAKCRLCAQGYRQGPLGWCIPVASVKRG